MFELKYGEVSSFRAISKRAVQIHILRAVNVVLICFISVPALADQRLAGIDIGVEYTAEVQRFIEEYISAAKVWKSTPMKLKKLLSPAWLSKQNVDPLFAKLDEPMTCRFGVGKMTVGRIGNDLLVDATCKRHEQGEDVYIYRLRLTRENGKLYSVPSRSQLSRDKISPEWQSIKYDPNVSLKSMCAEIGEKDDPKLQEQAAWRYAEDAASRHRLSYDRQIELQGIEFKHMSRKTMLEFDIDPNVSVPNGYAWKNFRVIGVHGPYVDIKAWNENWDMVSRLRTERVSDEDSRLAALDGYGIRPASTRTYTSPKGEITHWVNMIWMKLDVVDNYLPLDQECAAFGYK